MISRVWLPPSQQLPEEVLLLHAAEMRWLNWPCMATVCVNKALKGVHLFPPSQTHSTKYCAGEDMQPLFALAQDGLAQTTSTTVACWARSISRIRSPATEGDIHT